MKTRILIKFYLYRNFVAWFIMQLRQTQTFTLMCASWINGFKVHTNQMTYLSRFFRWRTYPDFSYTFDLLILLLIFRNMMNPTFQTKNVENFNFAEHIFHFLRNCLINVQVWLMYFILLLCINEKRELPSDKPYQDLESVHICMCLCVNI